MKLKFAVLGLAALGGAALASGQALAAMPNGIPQADKVASGPAANVDQVRMEMHQVRYFLAVAQLLNFTRAAEECNVTQPSLTRAIKQLEAELGGDLFRRERPAAQLTELGQRMAVS